MLESIQITAEYTQMALLAILPYVSDFGNRLGINIPNPLTTNSVAIFRPSDVPANDVGGYLKLTNGFEFWFSRGHVNRFSSKRSFYELQNPDRASEFYGDLLMNRQEAAAFARQAITNLGYSTEMLYADLEPIVTMPPKIDEHTIPHYLVEWKSPKTGQTSAEIEVDAGNKSITKVGFLNKSLYRPSPHLTSPPIIKTDEFGLRKLRGDELSTQLSIIPELIGKYAATLELPIPIPLKTNDIVPFDLWKDGEDIRSIVEITNHYRFYYRNGRILGFEAPDVFFSAQGEIRVKDFFGVPRIKQSKLIKMARETVVKLNLSPSDFLMDKKPVVATPFVPKTVSIPRFKFQWKEVTAGQLRSIVRIEMDATDGKVKSLYIDGWEKLLSKASAKKNRN